METLLDRITDYVPDDVFSIGFVRFSPALVLDRGEDDVLPDDVELATDERDLLVAHLRAVRDELRRTSSSGPVAWLDMAIVHLAVNRWRAEAEEQKHLSPAARRAGDGTNRRATPSLRAGDLW
jgi:hypothetical protein